MTQATCPYYVKERRKSESRRVLAFFILKTVVLYSACALVFGSMPITRFIKWATSSLVELLY